MKAEKYYLILAVVTGILCVPVLGEVESSWTGDYPVLLGRVNPSLAGIEQLYVIIMPPDAEPNRDGLVWKELEAKVEHELNEAGIKITPAISGDLLDIPELRIDIGMLKLEDSQQYVFRIQTSLATKVCLKREPLQFIKADVWKTKSVMQSTSVQSMPAAVTNVVLEQVEAFTYAYLAANESAEQAPDVSGIDPVPPTMSRKPSKPPAKQTVAEYKYVASKNSKVFHRPECSSAKRIKPENIIGYNNRDEAIKAGKRPCKRCKP